MRIQSLDHVHERNLPLDIGNFYGNPLSPFCIRDSHDEATFNPNETVCLIAKTFDFN